MTRKGEAPPEDGSKDSPAAAAGEKGAPNPGAPNPETFVGDPEMLIKHPLQVGLYPTQ